MRRLLIMLAVVLMASTAFAQTISKWTMAVYNVGAAQPISAPTDFVLGSNLACGIDPATVMVSAANPMKALWDDPAVTGKVCVYTDPGTGPLLSTPFGGSFEATLTASNSAGTSPESARAPFTRPGLPPSAPTGLRLGR
jgi:hypothetical protein